MSEDTLNSILWIFLAVLIGLAIIVMILTMLFLYKTLQNAWLERKEKKLEIREREIRSQEAEIRLKERIKKFQ